MKEKRNITIEKTLLNLNKAPLDENEMENAKKITWNMLSNSIESTKEKSHHIEPKKANSILQLLTIFGSTALITASIVVIVGVLVISLNKNKSTDTANGVNDHLLREITIGKGGVLYEKANTSSTDPAKWPEIKDEVYDLAVKVPTDWKLSNRESLQISCSLDNLIVKEYIKDPSKCSGLKDISFTFISSNSNSSSEIVLRGPDLGSYLPEDRSGYTKDDSVIKIDSKEYTLSTLTSKDKDLVYGYLSDYISTGNKSEFIKVYMYFTSSKKDIDTIKSILSSITNTYNFVTATPTPTEEPKVTVTPVPECVINTGNIDNYLVEPTALVDPYKANSDWQTIQSSTYNLSYKVPKQWTKTSDDNWSGVYNGVSSNISFSAINIAPNASIDDAAKGLACQKLLPYGKNPLVAQGKFFNTDLDARMILPSADGSSKTEALIIKTNTPIKIGNETYNAFVMYGTDRTMRYIPSYFEFSFPMHKTLNGLVNWEVSEESSSKNISCNLDPITITTDIRYKKLFFKEIVDPAIPDKKPSGNTLRDLLTKDGWTQCFTNSYMGYPEMYYEETFWKNGMKVYYQSRYNAETKLSTLELIYNY